jgi:phosphoglycolate phosphatase
MDATKAQQGEGLLNKIKAVIFDFDGTLAVLNINFSFMKEQVFDVMKRFGVTEESISETYLLEIINEVSQRLLEKKPAEAERFYEEAHRILHTIELMAAEEGRLLPGATATLERLRSRGMKIGIVTRNCEDAVRKVFPGIDHFCDVFVSRNSTKKVKPHPDHLTSVMKALNVSGEEAVMVGDHTIDIQAGKRVGMMTIGVLTGRIERGEFERAGADYVLREASEVCRLIEGAKGDPA